MCVESRSAERDLVWLEINMPEATNSEKQAFLERVAIMIEDGGLPEMEARKRARDEVLKDRGME